MKRKEMPPEILKATIRCIHKLWYQDPGWLDTPEDMLRMHRHMERLFNFAGIEGTLVKNNLDLVSPEQFAEICGIKEGN